MDDPSGCQSEERYAYAQSIHLCLFTVLFGENMLHVLLALLVSHVELMPFILIYDNRLKDLLSIFHLERGCLLRGRKQQGKWIALHIQVEKASGLPVLESVMCTKLGIVRTSPATTFSVSLEIGMKLWRTFILLLKESLTQLS